MKKKNRKRSITKARRPKTQVARRGYHDLASVGGQNNDWIMGAIADDADLWQNAYALTARIDDLFKTNPLYIKYRELLWANVFGSDGVMLRMKIQETENRIVYAPDEKKALVAHEARVNRLRKWAAEKAGNRHEEYRAFKLADGLESRSLDTVLRGQAMIEVGAPDIYANQLIEGMRTEWQRAEFCDIRGKRNYFVTCLLRLMGAVRHGDFFIRMIKDPKVNKFGFSLQMINAIWCDRFLNVTLDNGNVVIMGIEYEQTAWGLGKAVAYYFIKRVPQDWQYTTAGLFNYGPSRVDLHQRVSADEIIHYARPVDAEGTRPAPWVASTIPKGRQLDQYELAEVIAAREAACKTGFLYSDIIPEGGYAGIPIDPATGLPATNLAPGETGALPFGVKYQERDPKHPTANFETFRKGMVRSITAGMPAADYNTLANDLENINFSAGRLGRLDTNEMSKMLQRFDTDAAERPIFENWLEMSLITGAVPLPYTKQKFKKFNKPVFQGRRWAQVDEVKAVNAAALRVANLFSSDQREVAELGSDLEEILFEQAESNMMKEMLGLPTVKTVEHEPAATAEDETDDTKPATGDTKKPAPVKKPAKHLNGNGAAAEELEVSRI